MKRNLPALLLVFIFLFYWVSVPVVFAAEPDKPGQGTSFGNTAVDSDDANNSTVSGGIEPTVTIGGSVPSSVPVQDSDSASDNRYPIIEEVNKVLFEDKSPKEAVNELMLRVGKAEHTALPWE